jgi:hypothetical protein
MTTPMPSASVPELPIWTFIPLANSFGGDCFGGLAETKNDSVLRFFVPVNLFYRPASSLTPSRFFLQT